MSKTYPCTRGKIGSTTYYSVQMDANELLRSTSLASATDEWPTLTVQEKYQRKLSDGRVKRDIAPYFANDPDRFVASFVVATHNAKQFEFQPLSKASWLDEGSLPPSVKGPIANMGLLTIDGGKLVIIDGQHRVSGLRLAMEAKENKNYKMLKSENNQFENFDEDMFNVIIIDAGTGEGVDYDKLRKIFNNLNTHAKKTAKRDDIITSMDDGCAIITRRLMMRDDALGDHFENDGKRVSMVNWSSNTVSERALEFTSMSGLYQLNKIILDATGFKSVVKSTIAPDPAILDDALEVCRKWWETMFTNIQPLKIMMQRKRVERWWRMHKPGSKDRPLTTIQLEDWEVMKRWSMIFQPQGQFVMMKGIADAVQHGNIDLETATMKINDIIWSLEGNENWWKDIQFAADGTLLRQSTNKDLGAFIVTYYICNGNMSWMSQKDLDHILGVIRQKKENDEWVVLE